MLTYAEGLKERQKLLLRREGRKYDSEMKSYRGSVKEESALGVTDREKLFVKPPAVIDGARRNLSFIFLTFLFVAVNKSTCNFRGSLIERKK